MNPLGIDPVLISLGPLHVRWYGLMYVVGFIIGGFLVSKLCKKGFLQVPKDKVDLLSTYVLIGLFLGARLLYVFVYNWHDYSNNLWDIFAVWKGGLSFHGGAIGISIAAYLYARKFKIPMLQVTDTLALAGSQGILFGRFGNFVNGELFGRISDVPWAMVFQAGGPYPRHPSQLYEGVFEGLILFAILWFLLKRVKYYGVISSTFVIGYGIFRYFIEFFRQPDSQLGYYFGGTTTMGQILCFLMICIGLALLTYVLKVKKEIPPLS